MWDIFYSVQATACRRCMRSDIGVNSALSSLSLAVASCCRKASVSGVRQGRKRTGWNRGRKLSPDWPRPLSGLLPGSPTFVGVWPCNPYPAKSALALVHSAANPWVASTRIFFSGGSVSLILRTKGKSSSYKPDTPHIGWVVLRQTCRISANGISAPDMYRSRVGWYNELPHSTAITFTLIGKAGLRMRWRIK
jgi:hypothetical protein